MYELEKIKVQSLHHKTHVAELWHGQTDTWEQMSLSELAEIFLAVKREVARLELHAAEMPLNFAMPAVELVWPAAALLAWKGGMPLHLAICAGAPEDPCAKFLRTGRLPGGLSDRTREAAGVILEIIGAPEQAALARQGEALCLAPEELARLTQMIGVDAVTDARGENYVRKIYEMTEYVLHPETGRLYTGLQDYRVMWAESTPSVILALQDPLEAADRVCALLGLPDAAVLQAAQASGRGRFVEY